MEETSPYPAVVQAMQEELTVVLTAAYERNENECSREGKYDMLAGNRRRRLYRFRRGPYHGQRSMSCDEATKIYGRGCLGLARAVA
jgi:hypothetical protein